MSRHTLLRMKTVQILIVRKWTTRLLIICTSRHTLLRIKTVQILIVWKWTTRLLIVCTSRYTLLRMKTVQILIVWKFVNHLHVKKYMPSQEYPLSFYFKWIYWRGAWEKALSDVWLTIRFSFQIALYLLGKQQKNLTLHQVSLRALFHAPLQLISWNLKPLINFKSKCVDQCLNQILFWKRTWGIEFVFN